MAPLLSLHEQRVVEEIEDPPVALDQVRVRTPRSGVSAGTQFASYRGTTPFTRRAGNPARRIFAPPGAARAPRGG